MKEPARRPCTLYARCASLPPSCRARRLRSIRAGGRREKNDRGHADARDVAAGPRTQRLPREAAVRGLRRLRARTSRPRRRRCDGRHRHSRRPSSMPRCRWPAPKGVGRAGVTAPSMEATADALHGFGTTGTSDAASLHLAVNAACLASTRRQVLPSMPAAQRLYDRTRRRPLRRRARALRANEFSHLLRSKLSGANSLMMSNLAAELKQPRRDAGRGWARSMHLRYQRRLPRRPPPLYRRSAASSCWRSSSCCLDRRAATFTPPPRSRSERHAAAADDDDDDIVRTASLLCSSRRSAAESSRRPYAHARVDGCRWCRPPSTSSSPHAFAPCAVRRAPGRRRPPLGAVVLALRL